MRGLKFGIFGLNINQNVQKLNLFFWCELFIMVYIENKTA